MAVFRETIERTNSVTYHPGLYDEFLAARTTYMQSEANELEVAPSMAWHKDSSSKRRSRLPLVVYVLAVGAFLMVTSEFVVAGVLGQIAEDLEVGVAEAGALFTTFAIGMVVGAPLMAMLTIAMPKRMTLVSALIVFIVMHVIVAVGQDLTAVLVARFVSALATGAFWSVSAVVATAASEPSSAARAVGVVGTGGAVATVLGVPAGAFVAQLIGWRGTFWVLAGAAVLATVLVASLVPKVAPVHSSNSFVSQFYGVRSGRLWLVLAACTTISAGVFATYAYITPILTDYVGIAGPQVPLVLTGFGLSLVVGTLLIGRFGDAHWSLIILVTPATTAILLLGISSSGDAPWLAVALVTMLGLFGLSANSLLIHLAVRFAGQSATLGSALSISALNAGTALGTAMARVTLESPLGMRGPALVGAIMVALTLLPAGSLALASRRSKALPADFLAGRD
ncbi:MFS transporter [Pseudarthrobacter sp. R1]|uniref:MFS transporter n=1 Tax=Pseudarthrobacter sp. R1 TaxID=2944934 RepID=UPI00210F1874|nr:MFS transporter [Pseudarthrobacter sp. R1]MCQ6272756.1 MFS transporter [Pseudarthrobacter sp. R1]